MTPNRPLVVCDSAGRPVAVLEENEKGFRKSLEQGHLWALHPGTGRLLPFYEESGVTVVEHDAWYEAVLDHGESSTSAEPPAPTIAEPTATAPTAGTGTIGTVLSDLATLIARRHTELPEGSYTTHLFTSGSEKIRKKTGEEAVELLLASTRDTIVSESADLLYHLLVLLESEGISLEEIAAELARR